MKGTARATDEIYGNDISIIEIQNWTYMWRRNIITPVSTILLQDNSLKPADKRAFFLTAEHGIQKGSVLDSNAYLREQRLFYPVLSARLSSPAIFPLGAPSLRAVMAPSQALPILDPSAAHATDMRGGRPGVLRHTSFEFAFRRYCLPWPDAVNAPVFIAALLFAVSAFSASAFSALIFMCTDFHVHYICIRWSCTDR